ncbi:MAG: hypothetical protein M3P85_09180, partial [Actinomycetota bacterium]|nr:hypothetical protein [Actinomycetota bacterium]
MGTPPGPRPPATSTLPLGNRVALWSARGAGSAVVGAQAPTGAAPTGAGTATLNTPASSANAAANVAHALTPLARRARDTEGRGAAAGRFTPR